MNLSESTAEMLLRAMYHPKGKGATQSFLGSVSKVEMASPMGLIYKALYPSISTFETLPLLGTGYKFLESL